MGPAGDELLRRPEIVARLERERVVAILRGLDPRQVARAADALAAGGVTLVEVTTDSPGALDSIAALAGAGRTVGAGTVRTAEQATAAVEAGAQFCVSPAVLPGVIERCIALGVPCVPGALTPTEIETAWAAGAAAVKLYPASAHGPEYVREILAPLAGVPLVATGGITPENARDYIDAGVVAVGFGGTLVSPAAVEAGDWPAVTAAARTVTAALR